MSIDPTLLNRVINDPKTIEINEEFNNFVKKVGEVSKLVKDMASGDKAKADKAQAIADQYLTGKIIVEEDVTLKVKDDRTVINEKAFKTVENKDTGEMDKEVWMAEVGKDAEKRAADRKIRLEKADTLKTRATKAFRRGEYDKALSCYNQAISHIKDDCQMYCDRALTNIKLQKYDQVIPDCEWALRINENSFKARLYKAKAYKELEEPDKMEENLKELEEMYPQHKELIQFFMEKREPNKEEEEEDEVSQEEEEEQLTF